MLESPFTPQTHDILTKLATGEYILKFGQLYRIRQLTLFPIGTQLGALVDKMRNDGLIEKRVISINGVTMKCDMITNYARKRLEGK